AFDGAWLDALREVESALTSYAKERERVEALTNARRHASDAARLAHARFDAGQVSFLDVLQAEAALAEAEIALARAQGRAADLEISLFLALGGGWGPRKSFRESRYAHLPASGRAASSRRVRPLFMTCHNPAAQRHSATRPEAATRKSRTRGSHEKSPLP